MHVNINKNCDFFFVNLSFANLINRSPDKEHKRVEKKFSLPNTDFPILRYYQDPVKMMFFLTEVNPISIALFGGPLRIDSQLLYTLCVYVWCKSNKTPTKM